MISMVIAEPFKRDNMKLTTYIEESARTAMPPLLHLCPNGCKDDREPTVPRYVFDPSGVYSNMKCFACKGRMGAINLTTGQPITKA